MTKKTIYCIECGCDVPYEYWNLEWSPIERTTYCPECLQEMDLDDLQISDDEGKYHERCLGGDRIE